MQTNGQGSRAGTAEISAGTFRPAVRRQEAYEQTYDRRPVPDAVAAAVCKNTDDGTADTRVDWIFDEGRPVYRTTGCHRTGCCYCGFGVRMEKSPNRWETAERFSNPAVIDYMLRGGGFDESGLWKPDSRGSGFWFVIEWISRNGNMNIIMPHREKYLGQYMTAETERYLSV